MNAPQSWMQRALGRAITFVVVALLFRWAWELIHPFIPLVVGLGVSVVVGKFVLNRYRRF
jgi:CHASE2 domain-containing sensor protein